MESLIISAEVVAPFFFLMSLGYLLRKRKLADSHTLTAMNKMAFHIFIPALLLKSMYETENIGAHLYLVGYAAAGVIISFAVLLFVVPRLFKQNPVRGVLVQAIFRGNASIYGIPIALALCGDSNIDAVTVTVSAIVPIFNILAVISLEVFRREKADIKSIFKGILTNPCIIGIALGFLLNILKVPLPKILAGTLTGTANIAAPLSFIVLGGFLTFESVKENRKALILGVSGKLILMPLVWIPLAALLGFSGQSLVALIAVFASPAAVSSFTMAKAMGGDAKLANEIVVFSSALSVFTIFLLLTVLKLAALL
ncbi:MAG: AEC family transporter [Christensenellales bacterium]